MTLEELHAAMHRYNRFAAPGSECAAWQDFVAATYERLGHAPWADKFWDEGVPEDFAVYWTAVSTGRSGAYDDNGAR